MFSSMNFRKTTNQIIDLVDNGALDARQVLFECLNYMSEADVADMAHSSGILDVYDEDAE